MKKLYITSAICALLYISLIAIPASGQTGRQTYTGTILSYGSGLDTRTRTSFFTITVNATTPDDRAGQFLKLLQDGGQDKLLDGIKNENLGSFSVDGHLARTINVVRESNVDGKLRLYVVVERWTQFAELRGGYRSLDYPFGFIELYIDPATGKGEGTYIAAAQIRFKKEKQANGMHVEIEDFATFPARLLNVKVKTSSR